MPSDPGNHPGVMTRLLDEDSLPAGFRISVISEPQPVPEGREVDPEGFRKLSANGCFLFFVLHAG